MVNRRPSMCFENKYVTIKEQVLLVSQQSANDFRRCPAGSVVKVLASDPRRRHVVCDDTRSDI